jgi:hypothetical protein
MLKVKHRETFIKNYIKPLLKEKLIAMSIPETPKCHAGNGHWLFMK